MFDCTPVCLEDHSVVKSSYRGSMQLPFAKHQKLKALVVPSLHKPLISVSSLCDLGFALIFTSKRCDIWPVEEDEFDNTPAGMGYRKGNLYYLPSEPVGSPSTETSQYVHAQPSLFDYHVKFSHLGLKPLKKPV